MNVFTASDLEAADLLARPGTPSAAPAVTPPPGPAAARAVTG